MAQSLSPSNQTLLIANQPSENPYFVVRQMEPNYCQYRQSACRVWVEHESMIQIVLREIIYFLSDNIVLSGLYLYQ